MAQYFEILGLDVPPKDRREVKKAYSKKLKVTRPEDDPEGFMLLRDAHDHALSILAWQAQQDTVHEEAEHTPEQTPEQAEPSVTLADMIEDEAQLSEMSTVSGSPKESQIEGDSSDSPTAYAIGAVPSLDAPVQGRSAPPPPPLDSEILDVLDNTESRNDREKWNLLFRNARQLDIDDYVDFEALLLHRILDIHGFFDPNDTHYDQPEKQPKLLNPSITASLFKTMNWDKVGMPNTQQAYRIEWLERRMGVGGNRPIQQANIPATPNNVPNSLAKWFWPSLGGLFALAFLFDLVAG